MLLQGASQLLKLPPQAGLPSDMLLAHAMTYKVLAAEDTTINTSSHSKIDSSCNIQHQCINSGSRISGLAPLPLVGGFIWNICFSCPGACFQGFPSSRVFTFLEFPFRRISQCPFACFVFCSFRILHFSFPFWFPLSFCAIYNSFFIPSNFVLFPFVFTCFLACFWLLW